MVVAGRGLYPPDRDTSFPPGDRRQSDLTMERESSSLGIVVDVGIKSIRL